MTQLHTLNLTEKDFQLIIDGLDQLPYKNDVGEMMGELLIGAFSKDDPDAMAKIKHEREERFKLQKRDKDLMIEEIKILQGKLLMLKRYLAEQDALSQANNILGNFK